MVRRWEKPENYLFFVGFLEFNISPTDDYRAIFSSMIDIDKRNILKLKSQLARLTPITYGNFTI